MAYEITFKDAGKAKATYRAFVNRYRAMMGETANLQNIQRTGPTVYVHDESVWPAFQALLDKQTENRKRRRFKVEHVE
ncbi:hypothetical protein ACFLQN_03685 [Candidatus Aenigmatarchaeota archaeon]